MLDLIRGLLAHAEWADAAYYEAWGRSPARDHEQMRRRADHMIDVQHAFRSMLAGGPPVGPSGHPPKEFAELRVLARRTHADLRAFADGRSPDDLGRAVRIPFFPDPPCVVTVGEGLVQVAMHGQHHRGQLMTRLKDFGGEPVNVDWIIWLWKGRPAATWG